ncbi:MAG TPA: HAD family hydrolase [Nitriliruptorales bacterium]|nr:HAD family hydrolase [Nitriliruptorales bacterium]
MTVVTTVVFDVGLTLVRPEPSFAQVFASVCRDCGVAVAPEAVAAAEHLWVEQHERWRAAGEPSPWEGDHDAETRYFLALYHLILDHLDVDHDGSLPDRLLEAFVDHTSYGAYPDAVPALAELSRRGVRLAVLSNWGSRPRLRDVLAHAGLERWFDPVVVSGEVGLAKPDPALFLHLLDRLGAPAGPHVAYVGDDLHSDVAPARRLGLRAVLVDRSGRNRHHDGPRVTDLRQLARALPLPRPAGP